MYFSQSRLDKRIGTVLKKSPNFRESNSCETLNWVSSIYNDIMQNCILTLPVKNMAMKPVFCTELSELNSMVRVLLSEVIGIGSVEPQ